MSPGPEEDSPARLLERAELEKLIQEGLNKMPRMEGLVLDLYYRQGQNIREIAPILEFAHHAHFPDQGASHHPSAELYRAAMARLQWSLLGCPRMNDIDCKFLRRADRRVAARLLSRDQTEEVTVSWSRDEADQRRSRGPDLVVLRAECRSRVPALCRNRPRSGERAIRQEAWHAVLDPVHRARGEGPIWRSGLMPGPWNIGGTSGAWTRVPVAIVRGGRSSPEMYLALSPDLVTSRSE